ncbi:hypothetical protein GCM10010960_18520 [Arenimonas maotaiensis]|uniref:Uncharacterized protein n=1 Tax=Arenimonas maotaiensis TaxID=1446479 RepID=A0A917CTC8_9GAMM|nr:hypothetical protein GCM10010960_18520 [Arenimonas maotaiensis]
MATGAGIRQGLAFPRIAFGQGVTGGKRQHEAEKKGCFAHIGAGKWFEWGNYTQNSPVSGKYP